MIISDKRIQTIVSHRQPLSSYAQKVYDTVKDAGGFIKAWNITFSRAIGLASTGQADFLRFLDECIDKDYIRVIFKDNPKEKNGFFTFEYFYQNVVPHLKERNYEAYQFHIAYIERDSETTLLEKEPR